jgi:hypothetical protein
LAPGLAFARSGTNVYAVCMDYTPVILKNQGVSCEFVKLQKNGDVWERVIGEEGEPEKEVIFVKFTNNVISDIEIHFGGLEAWQEQLEKFPYTTVRQTFSLMMRRKPEEVGEAMLDGEVVMYSNIIGTAWAIANGVDPTVASLMLVNSVGLAKEQNRLVNEQLSKSVETPESPGTSGSDSGPKRASRSKTSGS